MIEAHDEQNEIPMASALSDSEESFAFDPSTDTAQRPDRAAAFRLKLAESTPRVYFTVLIFSVNVLLFILMTASGVSGARPTPDELIRWGGNFGPKTLDGEWLRLLTCAFVHYGFLHLSINLAFLLVAAPLTERMLGNAGFLVMYLFAGLGGSVVSSFVNETTVGAGASGAIFGIYGTLLALLMRKHGSIPPKTLTTLQTIAMVIVCLDLVFGFFIGAGTHAMKDGQNFIVDTAAHLGGFVTGFVVACLMSQPNEIVPAQRGVRNFRVAALGALLLVAGAIALRVWHDDFLNLAREFERFAFVEDKALNAHNAALERLDRNELSHSDVADLLERDVIPEWRAAGKRFGALTPPSSLRERVALYQDYIRLRQDYLDISVQSLRLYAEWIRARQVVDEFLDWDMQANGEFEAARKKLMEKALVETAFADLLERDLLPELRTSRQRIGGIKHVPPSARDHHSAIREYLRLRVEAWELYVKALRNPNEQAWQQANDTQEMANAANQRASESWSALVQSIIDASNSKVKQVVESGKLVEDAVKRIEENAGSRPGR